MPVGRHLMVRGVGGNAPAIIVHQQWASSLKLVTSVPKAVCVLLEDGGKQNHLLVVSAHAPDDWDKTKEDAMVVYENCFDSLMTMIIPITSKYDCKLMVSIDANVRLFKNEGCRIGNNASEGQSFGFRNAILERFMEWFDLTAVNTFVHMFSGDGTPRLLTHFRFFSFTMQDRLTSC